MESKTIPWWYLLHLKILKYSKKSVSQFSESKDMPPHLLNSKYYIEWGCFTKEEAMLTLRELATTIPDHPLKDDVPEMLSHMSDLLQQYFELDIDSVTEVILQLCRRPRLTTGVMDLFPDDQFEQLAFIVDHLSATGSLPKSLFEKGLLPSKSFPYHLMNNPSKLSLLMFHGVPCQVPEFVGEIVRKAYIKQKIPCSPENSRQQTAVFYFIIYSLAAFPKNRQDHPLAEIEEFLHTWRLCDPQPPLTPKELESFSKALLPDHTDLTDFVCACYGGTFSQLENKETPEPCRLQHLCRCLVRRKIFDNGSSLIFGVESLEIPKHMKDYLMLRTVEYTGVKIWPFRKRKLFS